MLHIFDYGVETQKQPQTRPLALGKDRSGSHKTPKSNLTVRAGLHNAWSILPPIRWRGEFIVVIHIQESKRKTYLLYVFLMPSCVSDNAMPKVSLVRLKVFISMRKLKKAGDKETSSKA